MLKRLFLKIDDTTLLNWRGGIAPASVDVVKQAHVPVTLMSNRSPQEMAPLVRQLGPTCAQIAFNGGLIYQSNKGMVKPLLTQSLVKEDALYLLRALMKVFPELSQSYYDQNHWVTYSYNQGIRSMKKVTGIEPLLVGPATYLHPQNPILKIELAPVSQSERTRLQQFLDYLALPGLAINITEHGNFEITSASLSTANAVQQVMMFDGLRSDEIIGFGQGWNNLPFLQNVGTEVASIAAS